MLQCLENLVADPGNRVLIHCYGGLGRTGRRPPWCPRNMYIFCLPKGCPEREIARKIVRAYEVIFHKCHFQFIVCKKSGIFVPLSKNFVETTFLTKNIIN